MAKRKRPLCFMVSGSQSLRGVRDGVVESTSALALIVPLWKRKTNGKNRAEGRLLKMRILVCGPLPTFGDPTSHSKMSGFEIFPNPTSHFTFLTPNWKWDTGSEKSEMGRHIAISTPNQ